MSIHLVREHYNSVYNNMDFFGHQTKLYQAFIFALMRKIGISPNSVVLDVGCGQGYLSFYLERCGMNVFCTDLSLVGLKSLNRYGKLFESKRVVADIFLAPFKNTFDMVFTRSCSLHNDFFQGCQDSANFINHLIDCAKPGVVVCIIYNSNLTGKGNVWFNPTFKVFADSVKSSNLCDVKFYAVNKIDSLLFGRYSFNSFMTRINVFLAKIFHKNCELVAIGRKTNSAHRGLT